MLIISNFIVFCFMSPLFISCMLLYMKVFYDVAGYPNPIQIFPNVETPKIGVPNWGSQKGGVLDPPPKWGSGLLSILRFSGGTPPPVSSEFVPPHPPMSGTPTKPGVPKMTKNGHF